MFRRPNGRDGRSGTRGGFNLSYHGTVSSRNRSILKVDDVLLNVYTPQIRCHLEEDEEFWSRQNEMLERIFSTTNPLKSAGPRSWNYGSRSQSLMIPVTSHEPPGTCALFARGNNCSGVPCGEKKKRKRV